MYLSASPILFSITQFSMPIAMSGSRIPEHRSRKGLAELFTVPGNRTKANSTDVLRQSLDVVAGAAPGLTDPPAPAIKSRILGGR